MDFRLDTLFYACAYEIEYKVVGKDVNYAFIESGDTLYIYFQGSMSVMDWIRNLLFFKKPYKNMKIPYYVHGGFLKSWKEVEDIVIEKITEKQDDKFKFNRIVSVGYSHGGPLSGFSHECAWYHRPDIRDNIFGFGFESPRFYHGLSVKKALKERWENYLVIRNHNDLVTHLPPSLFIFKHVGTLLHLKNTNTSKYKKPKCIGAHLQDAVLESLQDYYAEK